MIPVENTERFSQEAPKLTGSDKLKDGIIIAVPTRGQIRFEWALCIRQMVMPFNYNFAVRTAMGMDVATARNTCVQAAREVEAKYLLFWDDDVLIPSHGIKRLITIMDQNEELGNHIDLLTGIY